MAEYVPERRLRIEPITAVIFSIIFSLIFLVSTIYLIKKKIYPIL